VTLCSRCHGAGFVAVVWEADEDNDPSEELPKGEVCPECDGSGVDYDSSDDDAAYGGDYGGPIIGGGDLDPGGFDDGSF